jgi:hypothetical protein
MNFGRAPRYAPAEPLELATGRGSDFLGFGRPITAGTANAGRHDTGAATTTFLLFLPGYSHADCMQQASESIGKTS